MIISIEGIDGAGKNTLVSAIKEEVGAQVLAFPRYADSIHAQLAADALHGRMGDLSSSLYAMATLFALDRRGARKKILPFAGSKDAVLLLDRYVASNAAYSAARARDNALFHWVYELEFERFGLPTPDLQVLLDTPPEIAQQRASARAAQDSTRRKDVYEADSGLQERTYAAYVALARQQWAGRWLQTTQPGDILQEIQNFLNT